MASYIGIDLGTTYSAVATIDETGRPVMVENADPIVSPEGNITASCVTIGSNSLVIGESARKALQISDNAVGRFKREMGTSTKYMLAGQEYTPTDLSAAVLSEMKKIAEQGIGELSKVVITIPANFANEAREATLQAAKKAGLDVDFIINEPTAAALHYAYKNGADLNGIYAIYDLGGGTFDISVISIEGNQIDVLASNGLAKLGGEDFDNALTQLINTKFKQTAGQDLDKADYTSAQAEEDKVALSNKKRIVAGGKEQNIDGHAVMVGQSEFEEAISGLLAQTALLCDSTLDDANISKQDITDIILVGGSTRIPAVRRSVERTFGKSPVTTENPDEAVALGAALYAAMKSDGEHLSSTQKRAISKIAVSEQANKFFGTFVLGDTRGETQLMNSMIITKGTKIPCSVTKSFYTVKEGQTGIDCSVTESDNNETDPRWVKVIWQGNLDLPPNRPSQQEVQITYSYDENQVMHCVFKDVESGKEIEIMLDKNSADSQASAIDKFLVD